MAPSTVKAVPITIDFESLVESDEVTTQFADLGLLFSGATTLTSGAVGGGLNEIDFPPSSGVNVVYESGATGIRVDFANGATEVSGRFTYIAPLTMTAYSGATLVGSVTSLFDANFGSSGNPASELLSLAFADPISHVVFTTTVAGGSFTLDDFFANTVDEVPESVPEPATAGLLLSGLALAATRRFRVNASR
jgi:hypothetical protein